MLCICLSGPDVDHASITGVRERRDFNLFSSVIFPCSSVLTSGVERSRCVVFHLFLRCAAPDVFRHHERNTHAVSCAECPSGMLLFAYLDVPYSLFSSVASRTLTQNVFAFGVEVRAAFLFYGLSRCMAPSVFQYQERNTHSERVCILSGMVAFYHAVFSVECQVACYFLFILTCRTHYFPASRAEHSRRTCLRLESKARAAFLLHCLS